MATERFYYIRRSAGERWVQVTEKMYVSAMLSTDEPLTVFCPDGSAVAVVEAAPKCPQCGVYTVPHQLFGKEMFGCPVCKTLYA
jgi:hypothetical protein